MRLLKVKELAAILNVSPKTIYQWAEMGKIPCRKLNGALRFVWSEIEEWLEDCKIEFSDDLDDLV